MSLDKELFIVTYRKMYSNGTEGTYEVIKTYKEVQEELRRDLNSWFHPVSIKKIKLEEAPVEVVSEKYFVPKRYRTKDIRNPKYAVEKIWNKIWNKEE